MLSRIGKYSVEKELGQGGFGKVYLAFDPDVGQPVAIKKLLAEGDQDLLKRFQLEIRTTASLRHKNIVTIFASGEEAGDPYLVMEYLEGQTLKQVLQSRRQLTLLEKARIITQIADGLGYANSKGVVHRDVKPENIMLLPDDSVKIMDFGIALGPNRNTMVTQTGGIIGTPPYFAPEQLQGAKANEQTDIFSFGDVCYELLSGVHPFEQYKGDWKSLQIAIISYEPRPISELVPGCPEALETLVQRALAKEPEFRYQSFKELQLDAEAVLVDLRHEGAADILREIPTLTNSGNLTAALSRINQAYELDPGNREVRRLREEINLLVQREQVQTRVTKVLADAERYMGEHRYAEAVESLEFGARLDSTNSRVAARLEEAKARQRDYLRTNRLVSEARFLQQKGHLPECLARLEEALAIDPEHSEAKRLSQRVREELERRRLDQERQQAIRAAMDHRSAKRFTQAFSVLDALGQDQAAADEVASLRAGIEKDQAEEERRLRAERFNLAIAKTRGTLDAGDLERAQSMALRLEASFGQEPAEAAALGELRQRLDAQLRAAELADYQQRVRNLLKEKSFREALDLLGEALGKFPGDAGLERVRKVTDDLYRAHERAEAVAEVLKVAAARRESGDLHGALRAVAKARQELGDEAALVDLGRQLEIEIDQQLYSAGLDKLLRECRKLIVAGHYAAAIGRLANAGDYSGEAEVRVLLSAARSASTQEEERRFVEEVIAAAGRLQAASSWSEALGTVERGLARYPLNSTLTHLAATLRDRVEQDRRRVAIERLRREIALEIENREWDRAEPLLAKARVEFPGEPVLEELTGQIQSGRYEDGWRKLHARVQEDLAGNAVSRAEQALDEVTRTLFIEDPRWKALAREVARRREYEDALAEAGRRQDAGNLSEAEELLTEVIKQGPPDKRAMQLRSVVQGRRSEALRQQEIARLAANIREELERDDLSKAQAELTAARSRYPGESDWTSLQSDLDARQEALRRAAGVGAAAAAVEQAIGRDDLKQAAATLNAARARFPGEARWSPLETAIAKRHAALQRAAEVDALAGKLRRAFENENWDAAQAVEDLAAARLRYSGEPVWETIANDIAAHRDLVARTRAAQKRVLRHLDGADFTAARSELAAARTSYPQAKFWTPLEAEIARREGAAKTAGRVRELLGKPDLAAARQELASARKQFPQESLWDGLQAEIDAREQIDTLAGKLRRAFENDAWDATQALQDLAAARARFSGEPSWETIENEIATHRDQMAAARAAQERVQQLLDGGDFAGAQSALAAARTSYPQAKFWSPLEAEIARRADAAKLAGRIRELLGKPDLAAARQELASARKRYPRESLWDGLQPEIDAREEVGALAAKLRRAFENDAWDATQALQDLAAARARFPGEPSWETIENEIATHRDLMAAARAAQERVQQLLNGGDFAASQSALAAARTSYPQAKFWDPLAAEIARRVDAAKMAGSVRELLGKPDLAAARQELASARKQFPQENLWDGLQAEIDAREEVGALAGKLRRPLESERWDSAQSLQDLAAARARFPGEPVWEAIEGEIAARAAEDRVKQRLQAGDLPAARSELAAARESYPQAKFWGPLEAAIARREDAAKLANRIHDLLGKPDLAAARQELASARKRYPREAAWDGLQAEIEAREGIDDIAAKLRRALENDPWDAAQPRQVLDAARKRYPGEALWAAIESEIAARVAEDRVKQRLDAGDFTAARSELATARTSYPQAKYWGPLEAAIARREDVAKIASRIRELLGKPDLAAARQELASARKRYPQESPWDSLQAEIASREAIDALAAKLRRDFENEAWDATKASQNLAAARARFPGEAVWETIASEIAAHRDLLAAARAAEVRVKQRLDAGDFSTARSELATARASYPQVNFWGPLEAAIARREDAAKVAAGIRELLGKPDLAAARQKLASARKRYPQENAWDSLQAEIETREAIDALAAKLRRDFENEAWDATKASQDLTAARARFPGEAEWETIASEIAAHRDILAAARTAQDCVKQRLDAGDFAAARSELAGARKSCPQLKVWGPLEAEIGRRADVAKLASRIRELCVKSDLAGARRELASARKRYPQESAWDGLQAEIDARHAEADRQAAISAAAEGIRRLLDSGIDDVLSAHSSAPEGTLPIAKLWDVLREASARLEQARGSYPGETLWKTLASEISERRLQLEGKMAQAVHGYSDRAALDRTANQLAEASARHPAEPFWGTLRAAIDAQRARLKRQQDIEAAERTVRQELQLFSQLSQQRERTDQLVLQFRALQKAAAAAAAALSQYPGEERLSALQSEATGRRTEWLRGFDELFQLLANNDAPIPAISDQIRTLRKEDSGEPLWVRLEDAVKQQEGRVRRAAEIAAAGKSVRECLQRDEIPEARTQLQAARQRHGKDKLWTALEAEIGARSREIEELLERAGKLLAEARFAEVVALIEGRLTSDARFAGWLDQARRGLEEQRQREARQRSHGRLLEIERLADAETSKRKRKVLDREAQELAAGYAQDKEIAAAAARIHTLVDVPAPSATRKPMPWKPVAAGLGAALVLAAAFWWLHRPKAPTAPAVVAVPVEIRSDPHGAVVHLGDRTCTTPACQFELTPGVYQVDAQLQGYVEKRETITASAAQRFYEIELEPVPAPPKPGSGPAVATGSLVVNAGVAGALVYIDGQQRTRTDPSGSATLSIEAARHEVRVEKNGYDKAPAQQVRITAKSQQKLTFHLALEPARLEIDGAPKDVRIMAGGVALGATDGSPAFVFPVRVAPGDQSVEVTSGSGKRTIQHQFAAGEIERLKWEDVTPAAAPPVAPPPTTVAVPPPAPPKPSSEEIETRDWDSVGNASEVAPLRKFLQAHPKGAHAGQAESRIADLEWASVDKTNADAMRQFLRDNPNNNSHRSDAENLIPQIEAHTKDEAAKQALAKQEADRNALLKQQVVGALGSLNTALQRHNAAQVQKVWPGVSPQFLDSMKISQFSFSAKEQDVQISPNGVATVPCQFVTTNSERQTRTESRAFTFTFRLDGANWVVVTGRAN